MVRFSIALTLVAAMSLQAAEPTTMPRDGLKPLNLLVGTWKGSGTPEGSLEEKQKGHWSELANWEWQFKDKDVWLALHNEKGKFISTAQIRFVPSKDLFQLTVTTPEKQTKEYFGKLKEKALVFERTENKKAERLTFSLLHDNRITYRFETKPEAGTLWKKQYQVGLTKEGIPFVEAGSSERECIVSGGLGTMPVNYGGKTYYVCCSGCRDEFKENPAKYVKEWEEKRKKK
jgi:hypothetical protein